MGLSRDKKAELGRIVDELQRKTSGKFPSGNAKQALQLYKDCHHLISKIIHIEEEVSKTTDKCCDRRKDYGQLVKWLQDNGAKIVNLKIEEYDGLGNGLKATTKIKKQDLSILIPKKTMITSESAISSTIGHIIKADILLGQMPNVSLALHLLNESLDPSSFWTPYIKTLPREFTTVFYFEEELLELLQKSAFFEEIVKIYVSIARQYSYIFKVIQMSTDARLKNLRSGFTYDRFRWAVSVVMTRQNPIVGQNGQSILALIPFFDLANHERGEVSSEFDAKEECSKCYAMTDFEEGEQFFIDYGKRSIAEQFLHNGFISDDQYNQLPLNIPLSKSDPLQQARANYILKFDLGGPYLLCSDKSVPVSSKLLGFLRIYVMKEDKLKELACLEDSTRLTSLDLYEKETDEKAWKFLLDRCKIILMIHGLKSGVSFLDEDLARIENEKSPSKKLCLRFLAYEKQLLNQVVDFATDRLKSL
ncbi:actin-histidine N-methyltransferase-like isoform X2 [Artemia franciscana]|uniref:actin-histidine N-methyltransferase-like isoform X2 n=1 Tax=Artemia franciscana TaxID=6661 RepID=UPI0032DBA4DA